MLPVLLCNRREKGEGKEREREIGGATRWEQRRKCETYRKNSNIAANSTGLRSMKCSVGRPSKAIGQIAFCSYTNCHSGALIHHALKEVISLPGGASWLTTKFTIAPNMLSVPNFKRVSVYVSNLHV